MTTVPKVSLGLPVYNGEAFVEQAIRSALAQTFEDFELIICDNASTDSTSEICEYFAGIDSRIQYHRNPENIGAAPNFNLALELAKGEYFKWVAHDDVLEPEYLEQTVAVLEENADYVLAHSECHFIDEHGNFIRDHYDHLRFMESERPSVRFRCLAALHHWCFEVFGLIRREELARTPAIASYIGSDRNLLAELALMGKFRRLPEALFLSRDHSDRSIRSTNLRERAGWFAPSLHGKVALPHWRHLQEYWKSVHRVPLAFIERLRCYRKLLGWIRHSRQQLFADLKHARRARAAARKAQRGAASDEGPGGPPQEPPSRPTGGPTPDPAEDPVGAGQP
ncbi:MAG: glycosyltransferase family 2 protein [Planctomycetota bacterium]